MTEFLTRADVALRSAHLLLEAGDAAGAANRAYFSAFDAARAVLTTVAGIDVEAIRTHRGITHAFEVEVVRTGLIERDVGKLLTLLMEMRWAADYPIAVLTIADAHRAVAAAEAFHHRCTALVATGRPPQ